MKKDIDLKSLHEALIKREEFIKRRVKLHKKLTIFAGVVAIFTLVLIGINTAENKSQTPISSLNVTNYFTQYEQVNMSGDYMSQMYLIKYTDNIDYVVDTSSEIGLVKTYEDTNNNYYIISFNILRETKDKNSSTYKVDKVNTSGMIVKDKKDGKITLKINPNANNINMEKLFNNGKDSDISNDIKDYTKTLTGTPKNDLDQRPIIKAIIASALQLKIIDKDTEFKDI